MLPIRTIVYATDFSVQANGAFPLACALARDYGARLIILHIHPPPEVVGGEFGYVPPPDPAEELAAVRRQLADLAPTDPAIPVEHHLVEGDPISGIVAEAHASHCDLIVMGTHGRRGLGRLLLGSVAEGVLRRAPCPVLTVKAPVAAPKEEMEVAATV